MLYLLAFIAGGVVAVLVDRGIIKDKFSKKIVDKSIDVVKEVKETVEEKVENKK